MGSSPIRYEFGASIALSLDGAPSISYLVAGNRESVTVIAELCRREEINSQLYYRWSYEFLEAGK